MTGVLKAARDLANSKRVAFLVVIQPSVIDLTTNYTISYQDFAEYPEYRGTNLTSAVEHICLQNHISHVNLFDTFLRHYPETLFFKGGDNHWNDAGQDIAAQETPTYISENIFNSIKRKTDTQR